MDHSSYAYHFILSVVYHRAPYSQIASDAKMIQHLKHFVYINLLRHRRLVFRGALVQRCERSLLAWCLRALLGSGGMSPNSIH